MFTVHDPSMRQEKITKIQRINMCFSYRLNRFYTSRSLESFIFTDHVLARISLVNYDKKPKYFTNCN